MKTYWWRPADGGFNLGDELTSLLLSRKYNVEHSHSKMETADLVGVGSSLGWIWERPSVASRKNTLSVVGAGFMSQRAPMEPLDFLKIYSVRGLLSKNALGKLGRGVSIGDPGLLCSDLHEPQRFIKHKYGVILHHQKVDNTELIQRFNGLPVEFLDIRTADYNDFIDKMASCEIIISQSLHGLILADAYGIPNVWLNLGSLHSGGEYKFYDYFSSVSRPFNLQISAIPKTDNGLIEANAFTADLERIAHLKQGINRSFLNFLSDYNKS